MTKAAYLLFYRRRSSTPLGPESLQRIVQKDIEAGSDEDSDTENRSRSPAGNGLRLGGSSRNGSSRAGAVGAGAVALRGDGSALSAVAIPQGIPARNEAGLETLDGVSPPVYYEDETLGEDADSDPIDTQTSNMIGPLAPAYMDQPVWSFASIGDSNHRNDSDDASSNAPALGSDSGDDLQGRLLEDFGDEDATLHSFEHRPTGNDDDDEVADIHV